MEQKAKEIQSTYDLRLNILTQLENNKNILFCDNAIGFSNKSEKDLEEEYKSGLPYNFEGRPTRYTKEKLQERLKQGLVDIIFQDDRSNLGNLYRKLATEINTYNEKILDDNYFLNLIFNYCENNFKKYFAHQIAKSLEQFFSFEQNRTDYSAFYQKFKSETLQNLLKLKIKHHFIKEHRPTQEEEIDSPNAPISLEATEPAPVLGNDPEVTSISEISSPMVTEENKLSDSVNEISSSSLPLSILGRVEEKEPTKTLEAQVSLLLNQQAKFQEDMDKFREEVNKRMNDQDKKIDDLSQLIFNHLTKSDEEVSSNHPGLFGFLRGAYNQ